ncbi:Suppressor of Sensor Kinase (SLN1), partial [Rhizophlyctis rosea]
MLSSLLDHIPLLRGGARRDSGGSLLSDKNFCLGPLTDAESKSDLKATIQKYGGNSADVLDDATTFVIVEHSADLLALIQHPQDNDDSAVVVLLQDALARGVPIVTDTYVWQCILSKEVLPVDVYEVLRMEDGTIVASGKNRPSLKRSASEGSNPTSAQQTANGRIRFADSKGPAPSRPSITRYHSYHPGDGTDKPNITEADSGKAPAASAKSLTVSGVAPERPPLRFGPYGSPGGSGYGSPIKRRMTATVKIPSTLRETVTAKDAIQSPAAATPTKSKLRVPMQPMYDTTSDQSADEGAVPPTTPKRTPETPKKRQQPPTALPPPKPKPVGLERKGSGTMVAALDSPSAITRERAEWQTMLASVLTGDVIRSEKRRISGSVNQKQQLDGMYQLWVGLRAHLRGRSNPEERQRVEERRVDAENILEEVLKFTIVTHPEGKGKTAYDQVVDILTKIERVEALYPTRKALMLDKPLYAGLAFQHKLEALNAWMAITNSLRLQLQVLKNWTGSEDLLISRSQHPLSPETRIDTSFIDRILKESGVKRTFEIRIMTVLSGLLAKTKKSMIHHALVFKKMGLPTYINELQQLASFPSNLMEEILKVRLEYTEKLSKHTGVMLDQIIEDFGVSLSLAIRIKNECQELDTQADGWTITNSLSPSYDLILLKSLRCYFTLLNRRLRAFTESVFFKEAEMLEKEWNFMSGLCSFIEGGDVETAQEFCALETELLSKVISYLDSQMQVPPDSFMVNGVMTNNAIKWYLRMLENVRSRAKKLLKFHRVLSKEFENSVEYSTSDSFSSFLRYLLNSGHSLVRTDVYANQPFYIFASPSLYNRAPIIQRLLKTCFTRPNNEPQDQGPQEGYILIISAKLKNMINWQGRSMQVRLGKAPGVEIKQGRIRLVAEAVEHLSGARIVFEGNVDGSDLQLVKQHRPCMESVYVGLKNVKKMLAKLAGEIVLSVARVREITKSIPTSASLTPAAGPVDPASTTTTLDLVQEMFSFASDFGWRCLRHLGDGRK